MFRIVLAGLLSAGLVATVSFEGIAQETKAKEKAKAKAPKPPKFAINDPAKLKDEADFKTQGEYVGEVATPSGKQKIGIQMIALGDGKFEGWLLPGGLPGEGWDQKERHNGTGTREGDKVVIRAHDNVVGSIAEGKLTLDTPDYKGTLEKAERKSPTLGAKAPSGATVLYAGPDDASKWDKAVIVELSDGKFLSASGVRSNDKFQSFQMHVEFRTPWMPKEAGQQRGNSGVYLQDRYELQVLDSFGLKGVDNECGGIYKESSPKVNMCLPPMTWQTYDIDFTAPEFGADGKKTKPAKVSIKHNGVVIHDGLELKANTPGGKFNKEVPEPGSLYLQNHGDPVVFNNIWVVVK